VEPEDGSVKVGPVTLTRQQLRLGIYCFAGLIVLMILLRIVGGSGKKRPPETRR
jgi:hypothetical protein